LVQKFKLENQLMLQIEFPPRKNTSHLYYKDQTVIAV